MKISCLLFKGVGYCGGEIMRFSKFKFLSALIIGLLIVPSAASNIGRITISSSTNSYQTNYSNEELIDEYTWSVIKYSDWLENKVNSETINISNPTYGPLLILSDFMSPELCKVALEVYCENEDGSLDETNTLNKLVNYVNKSVVHYSAIDEDMFLHGFENLWDSLAVNHTGKKISAQEMRILGKNFCNNSYDFLGDCYSVSSFITAVLRLCGFNTKDVFNVNIQGYMLPIFYSNNIPIIGKPLLMGHMVNFVNADQKWYVIDGTMWLNETNGRLFTEKEKYQYSKIYIIKDGDLNNGTPLNRYFSKDGIIFFENEQYFLGNSWQPNSKIYSNINKEDFQFIFNSALTKGFNNARFSIYPYLFYKSFINRASVNSIFHPAVDTISLPYTIHDAVGETIDEKSEHLANLNREFINNHKNENDTPNQYDKAFYAYGYINVTYPQAYANAARLAGHTSWFGYTNDSETHFEDVNNTIYWLRENFKDNRFLNNDQVAFSDLTFILRKGSTVDQAVFAYGAIRNMKNGDDFWSADDLFVIITNDNRGYLAVNISNNGWIYLNFGEGEYIQSYVDNICFAFNENIRLDEWDN